MALHKDLQDREFCYDDFLLVLNRLPDFSESDVDLCTDFTRNIRLKMPLVSAPMDTVTGSRMAVMMALMGGIGVLHYNYATVREQIGAVERVKRFEAAFVKNPVVLSPKHTVKDIHEVNRRYGFYSCPITEDGTLNTKLVGIVTHRDIRYLEDMNLPLGSVMTKDVVTVHRKDTIDRKDILAANNVIKKNNLDTLPVVDDEHRVVALVTDSDLRKNEQYPLATKDENKQLRVFIAVEGRLELAKKRIGAGFEAGADGIVIEQSVAFKEQLDIARYTKKNFPKMDVVAGNVDSGKQVRQLVEEGMECIDAIKIGVGPGAACKTQEDIGVGRQQASAVYDCAREMQQLKAGIPLIADGGVKKPADIVKALALGAQSVMVGWMLAGTDEAPREAEYNWEQDRMEKTYRGMGSMDAMIVRSSARYTNERAVMVPEGEVKRVGYKGSGCKLVPFINAVMRRSMIKQGCRSIAELQANADIRPRRLRT